METIADILLTFGALGTGAYCFLLARRLRRFTDLESGVGGAVAVLSAQVDDLSRTLAQAQSAAGESVSSLGTASDRAEAAVRRLELMLAALNDLPETSPQPSVPVFVRRGSGQRLRA